MTKDLKPKNHGFWLDKVFQQLSHEAALSENTPTQFAWFIEFMRSEEMQKNLEEQVNSIDSSWLYLLFSIYPPLSPANRQLAILLYLGFSPALIALITGKENLGALYTAKNRLKKVLLASNSPQASTILKSLGFK